MKTLLLIVFTSFLSTCIYAQSWLTTGNSGITASNFLGTTDNTQLVFRQRNIERGRILTAGVWRFGTATDFARIDSAGTLTFGGNGVYKVAGNKYAFQYAGNPNYGLFFNSSSVQYEFRNGSATPVFSINANNGNGTFNGTLKVGAYILPSTDGTNGQVLKTNGTGVLSWSNDANSQWTTSGSNIFYNTGNVGIGTSTPAYKLDINGDLNLSTGSKFRVGGTQVLVNDEAGLNVFVGSNAGSHNSTGVENTAVGSGALFANTSGQGNTVSGFNALTFNTTGDYNTAFGSSALQENISGTSNTAIGLEALASNTTGNYNTAIGAPSLYANTTGYGNTGVGYETLPVNTTGYSNVAIGSFALYKNIGGHNLVAVGDSALFNQPDNPFGYYYNTAIGSKALFSNTIGYENTALGFSTLYANTQGRYNTAIGSFTLRTNTTGDHNTAIGRYALDQNTAGAGNTATGSSTLSLNTTGNNNTANGFSALVSNAAGNNNTAVGGGALGLNSNGNNNTAIGFSASSFNLGGSQNVSIGNSALAKSQQNSSNVAVGDSALYNYNDGTFDDYMVAVGTRALKSNTTGFYNTAIGGLALKTNMQGSQNTALGASADVNAASLSNATAIGYNAIATASNQVMLGNTAVTSVKAAGSIVIVSDGRFKKNLKENVPGLDFIKLLHPVTYNYDIHALNDHTVGSKAGKAANVDSRNNIQQEDAIKAKEKKLYTGFVAQEVEAAANKLNYDFSGVYKPANDKDAYGLSYSDFVVPLVKAVQELSKQNDDLKKENDDLKSRLDKIETLVLAQNQTPNANSQIAIQNVELGLAAKLEQNNPNPFNNITTINYYLPANKGNAYINFYNSGGVLLKQEKLTANGKGSIHLKTNELPSGTYQYSLIIDGKVIDTKQMIQIR
jgi:hypothetical protein